MVVRSAAARVCNRAHVCSGILMATTGKAPGRQGSSNLVAVGDRRVCSSRAYKGRASVCEYLTGGGERAMRTWQDQQHSTRDHREKESQPCV